MSFNSQFFSSFLVTFSGTTWSQPFSLTLIISQNSSDRGQEFTFFSPTVRIFSCIMEGLAKFNINEYYSVNQQILCACYVLGRHCYRCCRYSGEKEIPLCSCGAYIVMRKTCSYIYAIRQVSVMKHNEAESRIREVSGSVWECLVSVWLFSTFRKASPTRCHLSR